MCSVDIECVLSLSLSLSLSPYIYMHVCLLLELVQEGALLLLHLLYLH